MNVDDISPILDAWDYDPSNNVRRIVGADGREKVQFRVVINSYHGILQFFCDGRPDGARPHGREFALDYFEERLKAHLAEGGEKRDFRLSHDECEELFAESTMTYQRYLVLLQLNDFDRVIRDTARNMRVFEFVHRYAESAEDRERLQKWWPYILRIHHTARAMKAASSALDFEAALREIAACRERIEGLAEQDDDTFRAEKKRSLEALAEMRKAFEPKLPLDEIERIEQEKSAAVRRQDYERAAELRDRINALRRERGEKDAGGPTN